MTGFEAYKNFLAITLHFKSTSYDYFKYNGKVATKLATFTSSPQFYIFEKLASQYPISDNFIDFTLANLIEYKKIGWPGILLEEESKENYLNWKKKIDGLGYLFSSDCDVIVELLESKNKTFIDLFKLPKGGYPPIVLLHTQKFISLESLVILERYLQFCKVINKYLKDDFIWEDLNLRIFKYGSFLRKKYDPKKMKKLIKDKFQHDS